MGERVRDAWRSHWVERTLRERIQSVLLIAIVVIGIVFRSNRYWVDPIALWGDEAMWTRRLLELDVLTPSFRPLGFMVLSRKLAEWITVDERVLRLPSYLASIGSLLLFAAIGRRLLRKRSVLLVMMAVVAAQPMLVDFAKEFKPYSVELFFHLLMLWCALRVLERPTRGRWIALLALLPLVFFFAYNAIFFYPAVFSVFGWRALVHKNRKQLAVICGAALVCLLAIGSMYLMVFSQLPPNEDDSQFWGKKYGVFYIDDGKANQAQWELSKYAELVAMPGSGRLFWQPPELLEGRPARELAGVEELSWALLYVLGLVALGRGRRWSEAALLVVPVLTAMVFNVLTFWPWGAFRVNLFLMTYVLPVSFIGLDRWATRGRYSAWLAPSFSVALHLVPMLSFGFGAHAEKRSWTGHSEVPRILDFIRADRETLLHSNPTAAKEAIFLDAYTCETFPFYLKLHTAQSAKHREFFEKNFSWRCIYQPRDTAKAVSARRGLPTWVIVSNRTIVESIFTHVSKAGRVVIDERPSYNHRLLKLAN